MSNEAQLRITEVPHTLAPELWSTVDERYLTDNTIANLRHVHRETLQTLTSVVFAHRDVMADPTQTPAGNLSRSHAYASKLKASTLDRLDRAVTRSREVLVEIDEATNGVPQGPAPH